MDALSHREGCGDLWNMGGVKEEEAGDRDLKVAPREVDSQRTWQSCLGGCFLPPATGKTLRVPLLLCVRKPCG